MNTANTSARKLENVKPPSNSMIVLVFFFHRLRALCLKTTNLQRISFVIEARDL